MIIAIEKGLEGIKNYLEALHRYEIYYLDEYKSAVDVIIYKDEKNNQSFEDYQFESIHNALEKEKDISSGTLMIKATHKTGEQIKELLDARYP